MNRLATHGILGNKHFGLGQTGIGDNYFIGVTAYLKRPPLNGNRIPVRV